MRSQPVEVLEDVVADLRAAQAYYDSWRHNGSTFFLQQFRDTVAWIAWNPELFPRRYRIFRRAIIRQTYFGIFFAIEPTVTTIVAVADLRQRPGALRRLVKTRR